MLKYVVRTYSGLDANRYIDHSAASGMTFSTTYRRICTFSLALNVRRIMLTLVIRFDGGECGEEVHEVSETENCLPTLTHYVGF